MIASTGNMGSSVAAFAAFARLKCKIIIPEIVAPAKIAQMKAYGALIELASGDYADAMNIAENQVRGDPESFLAGDYPWRCEGTKTVGFEIADQIDVLARSRRCDRAHRKRHPDLERVEGVQRTDDHRDH